jgi:hypothetical protein
MTRHTNAVAALLLLSALAPAFAESPGRAIMTDEETTNYELLLELREVAPFVGTVSAVS